LTITGYQRRRRTDRSAPRPPARAEVAANPLPPDVAALLDKWEYSPPDTDESNHNAKEG